MKVIIKILSVILCAVILITAAPLSGFVGLELPEIDFGYIFGKIASAAETVVSGTCGTSGSGTKQTYRNWKLDSDGVLTISGSGNMTNYSSETDVPWYAHRDSIKTVVIENGVTNIGTCAFKYCYNLTSINIPNSVTSIGAYAFGDCHSLTSITIPDSVTSISVGVFAFCYNITSVTIPDSVTSIGPNAFYTCTSLISVTIPESVTSIGDYAFCNCSDLTSVSIPESVTSVGYSTFADCFSLASIVIPESVTSVGQYAFAGCTGLASIIILNPDCAIYDDTYTIFDSTKIYGFSGSTAQDYAEKYNRSYNNLVDFGSCGENAKWMLGDDGRLIIYGSGFMTYYTESVAKSPWDSYRSSIKKVVIENGISNIDFHAFENCFNLESITISDSVTSIGDSAFSSCDSLETIAIPDSVTIIGDNAFYNCDSLTSVNFGSNSNLQSIGVYSFEDCDSLESITIPASVTNIEYCAFTCCYSLTNVNFCNNSQLTFIGEQAFSFCYSLENIDFGDNSKLTNIEEGLFINCDSLQSISIPDSVTSIGYQAFSSCDSLLSITIPASVTSISNEAFYHCSSLENIIFLNPVCSIADSPSAIHSDTVIYGYANSTAQSYAQKYNRTFREIAQYGSCGENLTWVLDRNGTLSILGTGAMTDYPDFSEIPWYSYRTSIKQVVIGNGVTTIDDFAFNYFENLASVSIPASITHIGVSAFDNCTSLKNINVDENNLYYKSTDGILYSKSGENLHTYPAGRTADRFIIPSEVTEIANSAFWGCQHLRKIDFNEDSSLECIGDSAFAGCLTLNVIHIEKCSNISSIGNDAFKGTKLNSIEFSCDSAPAIPENADLFDGAPIAEVYVTDVYMKPGWIDYLDTGWAGLKVVNKSTTGEVISGVDENNKDTLGFTYNNFNLSARSVNISSFSGSGDVVIPRFVIKNNEHYFVISFNNNVFAGNKGITSVCLNDKIESIPASAFSGCTALKNVSFLSALKTISDYAFSGCTSLESVTAITAVEKIGTGAFYNCSALSSFNFRSGLTTIGNNAFYGCKSLPATVILPASVATIGNSAFYGSSLKTIQVEGKLSYLGTNAFGSISTLSRAKFKSDPPASVGSSPFGNPASFVVEYPDSNLNWSKEITNYKWKGYPAYTYSLISQLNSDDSYPIIVMTVTPDGAPYSGATVQLGDMTAISNEEGIALFDFPGVETQILTIIPEGKAYFKTSKELTLSRRTPVIISKLVSASELVEVTVDGKDINITPLVFNTGCFEEVKFRIKAIANDIEAIDLLSDDKSVFGDSHMFISSDLYTANALKDGAVKEVALNKFTEKKDVNLKITKKDGSQSTVTLNITVFNGGYNIGFKVSGKDENNKDKFKLDKDKVSLPESMINLKGCGVNLLEEVSFDLKLKDIIGALEFKVEQEKDCTKYYYGISSEDEGAIKKWAVNKKDKIKIGADGKFGVSLEGSVGGYIKFGCTSEHESFVKESCLFLAIKISADFGVTYWVVVPLRVEISLSGEMIIKAGLSKEYVDSYTRILAESDITLALKLRLGIGCKAVSAGVFGEGSVSVNIPSYVTTLAGEFGVYAKVLFVKYDYVIFKGSTTFGGRQEMSSSQQLYMQPKLYNTSNYETIEMIEPKLWNSSAVDEGQTVSLQENTYRYTNPQIVSTDDTMMMVFERLNSDYEIQNAQELVYSIFDNRNGTWSEPQPIQPGDEKFDNNFELYTDSTDIYAIFTQSNAVNDSSVDTAEEAVLYQDVYVTKYNADNGIFDTPERLTTNNSYDVTADIAVIDGIPTAVWVRNENGDPLTLDKSNSIYMSRYENGDWSDEIRLATGLNLVTGLDIGTLNDKTYIAVAVDSDNAFDTIDDSKLYLISPEKNIITKEIDGFGGNCEFEEIEGTDVLIAYAGGKALTISEAEAEAKLFAEIPEMSVASDAQFLECENGMYAISYLSLNEQGGCVRAVTYDGNEWHDAITISESEDYVGAYALDYRDGKFVVIMREDDLNFTSDSEFTVNSTLGGIAFTPAEEMYVSDAVIDSAGIIPGKEFTASLNIVNNSVNYSQNANVILKDIYGDEISSKVVEVDLDSGESKYIDVTLTAPDDISEGGYTITVEPVLMARTMSFRNTPIVSSAKEPKTFNVTLSASDLCVEAQQISLGSSQNVLVNITNDGSATSSSGMLYVREGDALSDTEAFTQLEIGEIAPGETKSYIVELPGEKYENGDGIFTAYIECYGDMYSTNNSSTLAILKMSEGKMIYTPDENSSPELSVSYIEADLYSLTDKTVEITLNDNTFKSIDGLKSGTHYTFSGNILTIKKAYLSTLTTGKHDITLNFNGKYEDTAETLTIYVSDSSPTPISGSVTISGDAKPGNTLTVATDNVTPSAAKYDIQWYVGGVAVSSETQYKINISDIGKNIYVKLSAKDGYSGCLTSSFVTVQKIAGITEFAPVEATKTCYSITLVRMDGYEYRISDGNWTTDVIFTDLSANKEYTFYSRKAETENAYAGSESVAVIIKTAEHTEGTAPTCTSSQLCTVCHDEIKPATPHIPGNEPTCTDAQKCSVCKAEIKPATGHINTMNMDAVKATCIATGFTEGIYCNDCSKYISGHAETDIDATAHNWDDGKITTSATCMVEGIRLYTCKFNPAHTYTENFGIDANNHFNSRRTAAIVPTCISIGYTAGVYCDDCESYISGHEEIGIDSENHKWDEGTITTTATCKIDGIRTYTCEYNEKHTYADNLGKNAENHIRIRNTEAVEPTCTDVGYTSGVYCDDCDKHISGYKEISINADNHVNTRMSEQINATCTDIGYTFGIFCNDCDKYVSGHEIIPVAEHTYTTIITIPTCTSQGYTTHICTACNFSFVDEYVNVVGHSWGKWTVVLKPSTVRNGKEERLCSACKLVESRSIDKLTISAGDVDSDGQISAADARLALRASVGLENLNKSQQFVADIDSNGSITAADARIILRLSVGLEDINKYIK